MATMTMRSPEWTDTAPVKVRSSRELLASPEEVWEAITDTPSWPTWFTAITSAEVTGQQDGGLGSRRRVTIQKRFAIDEEFIVWDPPRSWGFTVYEANGPFPRLSHSLNERIDIQVLAPDRVRVTYLMAWDPKKGRNLLFKRVLKGGLKKSLNEALDNLGQYIESRRVK